MTPSPQHTRVQQMVEAALAADGPPTSYARAHASPEILADVLAILQAAGDELPLPGLKALGGALESALQHAEGCPPDLDAVAVGRELVDLRIVTEAAWTAALRSVADPTDLENILRALTSARRSSVLEPEIEVLTEYQEAEILAGRASSLRLHDYVLRRELKGGRGGFGRVYRARDVTLDRLAAVKVLDIKCDPETLTRLQGRLRDEARFMAKLHSSVPSVPEVYHQGEHDGRHFIAMQMIEGRTLAQLVDEATNRAESIAVPLALTWVRSVAESLAQAHALDLVHCDIKPANVMVERNGSVHLLDLGIARLLRPLSQGSSGHSLSGHILGTPGYMAPEQSNGQSVGPKADVFGLGCTLYFLLYGCPPPSNPECVKRPPPSRRDVPTEVRALIDRMVDGAPDRRPTARSVAEDAHRLQESTITAFRATDLITLQDWPSAFEISCAVVGDRREQSPHTLADVLALPASSGDLFHLGRLRLDALIRSDKVVIIESEDTQREVLSGDLLVIGSPAANLCARIVNQHAAFRFAVKPEAQQATDLLIRELAPDIPFPKRFRAKLDPNDDNNRPRLRELHHLHTEFSKSGFIDPVNYKALRGTVLKSYLDFGIVSLGRNPWDPNGLVVFAAGIHGPGTAAAVQMLIDPRTFDQRPMGGVFKVEISQTQPWSRRYEFLEPEWDTDPYTVTDYELAVKDLAKRTAAGEVSTWEGLHAKAEQDAIALVALLRRRHARAGADSAATGGVV